MKRSVLAAGLSLAIAGATGVAVAAPGAPQGNVPPSVAEKVAAKKAEARARVAARPVLHVLRACVTADATQQGAGDAATTTAAATLLSQNAHARRALGLKRGDEFTARIGANVRLVGRARVQEGTTERLPIAGSWENLEQGDVITIRVRAPRNVSAAAFPAANLVIDHGPIRPAACPPAEAPETQPEA